MSLFISSPRIPGTLSWEVGIYPGSLGTMTPLVHSLRQLSAPNSPTGMFLGGGKNSLKNYNAKEISYYIIRLLIYLQGAIKKKNTLLSDAISNPHICMYDICMISYL